MGIGDNIRKLQIAHDMTQEQLGNALGKTRSAISQYETGIAVPRKGVIANTCRIFDCGMYDIIGGHVEYAAVTIPTTAEHELLELFRKLDEPKQQALLSVARAMVQQ